VGASTSKHAGQISPKAGWSPWRLTDLLVVLLGLEADDLQDAGAGDVRHHVGHALPDAQQRPAQHVVLAQPHALQALLALLDLLALAIPAGKRDDDDERTTSHVMMCSPAQGRTRSPWDRSGCILQSEVTFRVPAQKDTYIVLSIL